MGYPGWPLCSSASQANLFITLLNAGCCRFFTFTQFGDRPGRYGRSLSLDTGPSSPIRQACRNSSGPISPCFEVSQTDAVDPADQQSGGMQGWNRDLCMGQR